jgi:hypothetical protein
MMARTSSRTMTMIAMTMLPDMVVCLCGVVWEWLEVVEVGTSCGVGGDVFVVVYASVVFFV